MSVGQICAKLILFRVSEMIFIWGVVNFEYLAIIKRNILHNNDSQRKCDFSAPLSISLVTKTEGSYNEFIRGIPDTRKETR